MTNTTTATAPSLENPGPAIIAMREMISAIANGEDSPIFQKRLAEAEAALNIPSKLLLLLSNSWANFIAEQIAHDTGIRTDNLELVHLGALKNFEFDDETSIHLSLEYKVNMSNPDIATVWLNIKAFESLAYTLERYPSSLPSSMVQFLYVFKEQFKPEYQEGLDRMKEHLIAYLRYGAMMMREVGNRLVEAENKKTSKVVA